jgi:hypothetical protein
MALQPDGGIVLVGTTSPADGSPRALAVACFLADGAIDSGFGTVGMVTTAIYDGAFAAAVALQADGSILVVGTADNGLNNRDFAVVRYVGQARRPRRS